MFRDRLMTALKIKTECIWIKANEEELAMEIVKEMIQRTHPDMLIESVSIGLGRMSEPLKVGENSEIIPGAFKSIMLEYYKELYTSQEKKALVFRDGHILAELKSEARSLKDVKERGAKSAPYRPIIVISPDVRIPMEQDKMWTVLEMEQIEFKEIKDTLQKLSKMAKKSVTSRGGVYDDTSIDFDQCANLAKGLTSKEILRLTKESVSLYNTISVKAFKEAKLNAIKKTGMLKFIESNQGLGDIGGNENFKKWIADIKNTFSKEAKEFGVESPKGYLSLGVPGQVIFV